jgi:hypothetical protein
MTATERHELEQWQRSLEQQLRRLEEAVAELRRWLPTEPLPATVSVVDCDGD